MKKRQKIDDIYREKLRNVETTPPADVWQNITAALPENKKDRIVPLWFQLGGIAAALVLMFSLFTISPPGITKVNTITTEWEYPQNPVYDPVSPDFLKSMEEAKQLLNSIVSNDIKVSKPNQNTKSASALTEVNSETPEQNSEIINEHTAVADSPSRTTESNPEINPGSGNGTNQNNHSIATPGEEEEIISQEKTEVAALGEPQKQIEKTIPPDEINVEIPEKTALSNRFSITTTAAAVYFDNMGSGNMLDEQFANNETGGEITMSYGVNLAYQLSEKIKIRSGISKVDLNYNTQNLTYASVARATSLSGLENAVSPLSFSSGSITQNFGFIEVPLEMEFALIQKKVEVNLIGGASTFFLDKNRVSLDFPSFSSDLGEADNLNNTSFSANLGLGLHYNISTRFQLNMEPIFKYQLNTFRNTKDANPYLFGIYSGVRYKF